MNHVSLEQKERSAAGDPLVWIAVDNFRTDTKGPAAKPAPPEGEPFLLADRSSDHVFDVWNRLAEGRKLPDPSAIDDEFFSSLADQSITFDLVDRRGSEQKTLKVRQIGQLVAEAIGVQNRTERASDVSSFPLLADLQAYFADVFERREPVIFEIEDDQRRDEDNTLECIIMPFGNNNIRSVVAVFTEKVASQQELGEEILNLEESSIVESPKFVEADDIIDLDEDDELVTTGQLSGKAKAKATGKSTSLSVGDLVSEARKSADLAREAEEKSRQAARDAFAQAYALVLAMAQSPEEIAAELVFGSESNAPRTLELVKVLREARESGVSAADLGKFLAKVDSAHL